MLFTLQFLELFTGDIVVEKLVPIHLQNVKLLYFFIANMKRASCNTLKTIFFAFILFSVENVYSYLRIVMACL